MKRAAWLPPLFLAALTGLVFCPALRFGFLYWDDVKNIVTNPHLRHLDADSMHWMWTTHFQGPYQPLSWMSLALDYQLWSLRPLGYHLTNILLHMANTALAYLLLRRLFDASRRGTAPSIVAAGVGALFFAVHPLRVESVAWATERRDVLSGFFFLLALAAYTRRRQGLSLLAFAAALLAKATAVGLVWALIALDLTALERLPLDPRRWKDRAYRGVWREKLPYVGMALGAGLFNLCAFHAQGILQSRYGLWERLALFLHNAAFYFEKMLVPFPLLTYYELPVQLPALGWILPLHIVTTLLISATCWMLRRRTPGLLIAWVTYLLILLPVSGVAQNGQQLAADRYTYLMALPWAALVTALLQRRPRWQPAAFGVLAFYIVLTGQQLKAWRTDEALWMQTLRYAPNTYFAQSNLGTLYMRQGRDHEAMDHLQQAVRLRPGDTEAFLNLGVLAEHTEHYAQAETFYRAGLRADPGNAQLQNNLALARAHQKDFSGAVRLLKEVVAAHPDFAEAHLNLGVLLLHEGFKTEGQRHIRQAVALNPELANRLGRSIQ